MLKILQARLQQYMNHELPNVQAGFRKGRGTKDQIANICWIMKKAREFQKNIYFCFFDYAKALTVRINTNCGKFLRRWESHCWIYSPRKQELKETSVPQYSSQHCLQYLGHGSNLGAHWQMNG